MKQLHEHGTNILVLDDTVTYTILHIAVKELLDTNYDILAQGHGASKGKAMKTCMCNNTTAVAPFNGE